MQILEENTKLLKYPVVAAIGCFDGVHRGHCYLIEQVVKEAEVRGINSMLITFPVHPRQVMQKEYQPELLSCLPQRKAMLLAQPVDFCLLLSFTRELSRLSAREFMHFLRDRYQVQALVIGHDHRFGHNRSEGFEDYRQYGRELGIDVIQARGLTEDGLSISSSLIRRLLKGGQLELANHYLGYEYYLDGKVVSGHKLGRTLGFPTANLEPSCKEKLIPAGGVYAARVDMAGEKHVAMVNIGYRPTVNNGRDLSIEAHILDYAGDIYGWTIRIELVCFIRPEEKFISLEDLVAQLNEDRKSVERLMRVSRK